MTLPRFQSSGVHLIADLDGIEPARLANPELLETLLRGAADAAGATILFSHFHHFGAGSGVTGVVLLAESHISIHTWPEFGFAAADIFLCGAGEPERALDWIESGLGATQRRVQRIERGGVGIYR